MGDVVDDVGVGYQSLIQGRVFVGGSQAGGFVQTALGQFQLPEDVIVAEYGAGLFGEAFDGIERGSGQGGPSRGDHAGSHGEDEDHSHCGRGQGLQSQACVLESLPKSPPSLDQGGKGAGRGGSGHRSGLVRGDALHQVAADTALECGIGREPCSRIVELKCGLQDGQALLIEFGILFRTTRWGRALPQGVETGFQDVVFVHATDLMGASCLASFFNARCCNTRKVPALFPRTAAISS